MADETLRIIGFIKRRPDLTPEQFYEHWEKVHAPLVVPWILKHGFTSYMQIHATEALRNKLSSSIDFDGAGSFEIRDYDQFLAALSDPYYHNVIAKDELNFIDRKTTEVWPRSMGIQKNFVVDGKATIDTSQGSTLLEEWDEKGRKGT